MADSSCRRRSSGKWPSTSSLRPRRSRSGQEVHHRHHMWLPWIELLLLQHGHEPLAERVERLLGLPYLVDHEVVALTEAGVVHQAGGRPRTSIRKLIDNGSVLLLIESRRVEVDRDSQSGLLARRPGILRRCTRSGHRSRVLVEIRIPASPGPSPCSPGRVLRRRRPVRDRSRDHVGDAPVAGVSELLADSGWSWPTATTWSRP